MDIPNPFNEGYCKQCEYMENGKCLKNILYNKPVPVFVITKCSNYSKKDENKTDLSSGGI